MRVRLTLSCRKGAVIALNNRYELSAVLYKILSTANEDFAKWLHDRGYGADGRFFKLFTFSWLQTFPYDKVTGGQVCKSGKVVWEVSFCVDELVQHFVEGLFQNAAFTLKAGFMDAVDFVVEQVEVLPMPNLTATTIPYRCITPILIGRKNVQNKNETYLSPLDEAYASLFLYNLRGKVMAVQGDSFREADTSFRLLSQEEKVKPKGFQIHKKEMTSLQFKPYLFDFELTAPPEWHRIGYDAGFGQDNALGLGMVEMIKK